MLVKKCCAGDPGAFNLLVGRWQARIHRLAYRYFGSYDEAMEITQKTFIKVYKKLDTLDDQTSFPAWIYRIAQNLCRDEAKRAGRRHAAPMEALAAHPATQHHRDNPDRVIQQQELGSLLQQALNQLPPEQRMVVIMKEYEGLKFREIADILETPESTVKSRMYYGLRSLRILFDHWNIEMEDWNHE